ncbi:LVIVD repeat-containing protein [Halotalea alkalilenta]|uniref:LVIVD repeat-containing protein n=1 Tax=Halotalea alkalilenta TaxID=376489 RepID=UPI0005B78864|nr:hypothetical protein [Halotalea alkalilenta]
MLSRRQVLLGTAGTIAAAGMVTAQGLSPRAAAAGGSAAPAGAAGGEWKKDALGAMTRNVELLAYHDLGGPGCAGYQMSMQEVGGRMYLYCMHWAKVGMSILEVTDPSRPRFVRFVPEPSGKTGISSVKLQIADGIGISNMQTRQFEQFFGPQPAGTQYDEGLLVWNMRDPEDPKLLARWHTGTPKGTHRNFYNGGRYVHLAAGAEGYDGFIYQILDISDPANPRVAGQWAHPEQAVDASRHVELHMPYIEGDRAYLAYWGIGLVILDISNVANPKHIGTLRTHPPFGGGSGGASMHTTVPYLDRELVVVTTEGERPFSLDPDSTEEIVGLKGKQQPMNMVGVVSIQDPANPVLVSTLPKPVPPPGSIWGTDYSTLNGAHYPFGNHNIHQPSGLPVLDQGNSRIYCAYFTAGFRCFDFSEPYSPREIAAYCPPDPKQFNWQKYGGFKGPLTMCAEDIIVDRRGIVYMTNSQDGLHILKVTA